jgi:ribosomal protein S8
MKQIILKFWVQLKNNSTTGNTYFEIKSSIKLLPLLHILYEEGCIRSFIYSKCKKKFIIYTNKKFYNSLILWGVSSKKNYLKYNQICNISSKNNLFLVSTNKGYKTIVDCKKTSSGGRLYVSI